MTVNLSDWIDAHRVPLDETHPLSLSEEVKRLRKDNIKLREDKERILLVLTETVNALIRIAKERRT